MNYNDVIFFLIQNKHLNLFNSKDTKRCILNNIFKLKHI